MRSIRSRLLALAVLAALLPAIPLSLTVRDLLDRSFGVASTVRDASLGGLEAGLEESREALRACKAAFAEAVAREHRPMLPMLDPDVEAGLVVIGLDGRRDRNADVPTDVRNASPAVDAEPARAGAWLVTARRAADGAAVTYAQPLPPEMVARAEAVTEALTLLRQLRRDRDAGRASYVSAFLITYAATLALTLAIALWAARRAARSLEDLAAATARVGDGDFTARVDAPDGGEVGDLAHAFNAMVGRLDAQQRDLARLEKLAAWRRMARILAHEIKNPLTPILLAVQETRRGYRGDDDAHAGRLADCESIVTEEVDGLRDLVRSFSDFARMPRPEPAPERPAVLLDDLARLYGDRLAASAPPADLVWSYDAAQLRRALINLVDNGLAACRRAGREERVDVAAIVHDGTLVWTVRDAGGGIPEELRDRVFEPDVTGSDGGMGLGLPVVAGIVEGHGGRVGFDTSPDGTVFTLELPAAPGEEIRS